MNQSSLPPLECVLGKQTHEGGPGDGSNSDPDDNGPRNGEQDALMTQPQSSHPSISNVAAST